MKQMPAAIRPASDITTNYYALTLCIFREVSPDAAFDLLETGKSLCSDDDAEYIMELKKTKTFSEIGKMYGLDPGTIFRRIERYKERQKRKQKGEMNHATNT